MKEHREVKKIFMYLLCSLTTLTGLFFLVPILLPLLHMVF